MTIFRADTGVARLERWLRTAVLSLAGTTILLPGPPVLVAQQAAPTSTADLELEIPRPFTKISGVARLTDGRLVVADREEKRIVLLDPSTGRATDVGARGQGPQEFLWPFAPVGMPDGTVLVYDGGNRRFLVLDAEGRPVGTLPWPDDSRFGGGSPPRGADSEGRLYWLASPPYRGELPTVGIVVHWRPGDAALTERARVQFRDARNRKVLRQFVTRDGWAVTSDGAIGVARGIDPHVEWVLPDGTTLTGPSLDIPRFPIDEAELAAVDAAAVGGRARTEGASGEDRGDRRRNRTSDWVTPEHLPPFEVDHIHASPTGELWVPRRLPVGEPHTEIWIFDERARLRRKVRIEGRVDLLWVGDEVFYAAVTDDLGLQRLRRYGIEDGDAR